MPDFIKITFDTDELVALRRACDCRSGREERLFDETAGSSIEAIATQECRTDDMLLIKGTVAIFKPGQTILITKEDLGLMHDSLLGYRAEAEKGLLAPIDSAIKKIEAALPQ
jgi:hypothetical protein